jgi:hypothetical protein
MSQSIRVAHCLVCHEDIRVEQLDQHVRDKHSPVCCLVCHEETSPDQLEWHVRDKHSPLVCCVVCEQSVELAKLDVHIRDEHWPIHCRICRGAGETVQDLAWHYELVHECPRCDELFPSEAERDQHLDIFHGGVWQIDEPIELRPANLVYHSGREPVPREPPADPEARARWLYPLCLQIVDLASPVAYLRNPPADHADAALYIATHLMRIPKARQLARYRERRTPAGRAAFLARVLAMPDLEPAYAEQRLQRVKFDHESKGSGEADF